MMFLYYQEICDDDCEPELLGIYSTLDTLLEKIKEECDNKHEICPNSMPSYEEYINRNFDNYKGNKYYFNKPLLEHIISLKKDKYIEIIHDHVDGDEYMYVVSNSIL